MNTDDEVFHEYVPVKLTDWELLRLISYNEEKAIEFPSIAQRFKLRAQELRQLRVFHTNHEEV